MRNLSPGFYTGNRIRIPERHHFTFEEASVYKAKLFLTIILFSVLLVTGSAALAENITPVLKDERIQEITLPVGIVTRGEPDVNEGVVTLSIDYDATDWTEVLKKNASRDNLCISLRIAAPEGSVKGVCENISDADSSQMLKDKTVPQWFMEECSPENLVDCTLSGEAVFAEIQMG